jgi:release factor glutamine methyltransferase
MTDEARLIEEKYGGAVRAEDAAAFAIDTERLASGEPLAYVIGWQPFMGLKIWLDSKPLIPRSETEWIAEKLIAQLREGAPAASSLRALDLCAGSGAIGCALLARVPGVRASFGELLPAHEATIRKNVAANGLDAARADIRIGDLFAPFAHDTHGALEQFDIIVANPPYIPDGRALDDSVSRYEPAEALRGGPDGLAIIRRIATEAPKHLAPGGELWMELDAPSAEDARGIVERALGHAALYPDPYGRPRLVVGHCA